MIKRICLLLASFLAVSFFTGCSVAVSRPMVQPMREPPIPAAGQTEVVVTLVPQATRTPAVTAAAAEPVATTVSSTATTHASQVSAIGENQAIIIRSKPATSADVLMKMKSGEKAELIGRSAGGEWLQVRFNGQTGWLYAPLVLVEPPSPKDLPCTDETEACQQQDSPFAQAMANIRTLTGLPDLQLTPAGNQSAPNASLYPGIVFKDDMGNSYYVYQETQRVIEFTLERMPALYTPGQAKSADELRGIALQYAAQYSVNFEKYQKFLTYTESGKGENFFYRWEFKNTDVGGMPALLQIGLKSDGQIFGYLNSLDLITLPGN